MSFRDQGKDPLEAFVKDVERRVSAIERGGGRGPGSSYGLPFQIGQYRFFEDHGRLCVLNLDTLQIQCMQGDGGGCLLRVNRYFEVGDYPLDLPGGTQLIEFFILGGGGGGGGGARPDTGDSASGGGGGGNGCCTYSKLTIEQFLAIVTAGTATVHVGAGGVGGDAATVVGAGGIAGSNGDISYVELVSGEGINGLLGGPGGGGGGGTVNGDADGGTACRGDLETFGFGGNLDWLKAGHITGGISIATFDISATGGDADQGFCSGGGGGGSATRTDDTVSDGGNGRNGVTPYYMVGNGYGGNGGTTGVGVAVQGGRGCGGGGGGAGQVAVAAQAGAAGGAGEVVVIFTGGCGGGALPGDFGDAGGNIGGGGAGDGSGGPGGLGGGGGGGTGMAPPPPPEPGSFTDYKLAVLAEMVGYAAVGGVYGGLTATDVVVVTNTDDDGAGSLREALMMTVPRYIVFDPIVFPPSTPTTITLLSAVNIGTAQSNFTVDAYEALVNIDGYDIITGDYSPTGMSDICENFVFINIRHNGGIAGNHDCWTIDGSSRWWMHHCEALNGGDGAIDITGVGSAATPYGMCTVSMSKIGNTVKNNLLGDQTTGNSDYDSPTSTTIGGDCRITYYRVERFGTLRNPAVANYWLDDVNPWIHDYDLEGAAVVGMCAMVRHRGAVVDGAGATFPERGLNSYDESAVGDDGPFAKNIKWRVIEDELYLNGADAQTPASLNPDSTMTDFIADSTFAPYTLAHIVPVGGGNNLTDDMGDTDLTNPLRSGQIDRLGYWSLVV